MAVPPGHWAPGEVNVPSLAWVLVVMLLALWPQNGNRSSNLHSRREGGNEQKIKYAQAWVSDVFYLL